MTWMSLKNMQGFPWWSSDPRLCATSAGGLGSVRELDPVWYN